MVAWMLKCSLILLTCSMSGGLDRPKIPIIHPLYISVTEFNYNETEHVLEISCKMFADDFEKILNKQNKTSMDISSAKDKTLVEKMAYDYIRKHLRLSVNGSPVNLQFVGFEKENEAAWTYLQVNNVTQLHRLDIMNNLLYDAYDSQISIMHVMVKNTRKSTTS